MIKLWLNQLSNNEKVTIKSAYYNFMSDSALLEINKTHLKHNFYTDIITFNYSQHTKHIEAEIFISIDRIRENAKIENVKVQEEIVRVMAHGLLHCIGYKDKTKADKEEMRKKENHYVFLYNKIK